MLTLKDLEAAQVLERKATPGPWRVNRFDIDNDGAISYQLQQDSPAPGVEPLRFEGDVPAGAVICNINDDEPVRAKHDAALLCWLRNNAAELLNLASLVWLKRRMMSAGDD